MRKTKNLIVISTLLCCCLSQTACLNLSSNKTSEPTTLLLETYDYDPVEGNKTTSEAEITTPSETESTTKEIVTVPETTTEKVFKGTTYTYENCSMKAPKGWIKASNPADYGADFSLKKDKSKSLEIISLAVFPKNQFSSYKDLNSLVKDIDVVLKLAFEDITVTRSITREINGKTCAEICFTSILKNTAVSSKLLLFYEDGVVYELVYSAVPTSYNKSLEDVNNIFNSFTIQ